jgi:hypothetical protein
MRRIRLFLLVVLLGWASAASAEVEIHFHSKDFASTFPHAFVRLTGTDPSTGKPLDVNYGFTPERLSPGILVGPVRGMIETVDPVFVARSDRHFTLKLSDEQYRSVMAVIESWRAAPQPSYRLNSRNCVHFVAEVATVLGLNAPPFKPLMKKPKSFLRKVTQDNLALIRDWPAPQAVASQPSTPVSHVALPSAPAQ